METIRENPRRIILIGLALLVLICLVSVIIIQVFFTNPEIAGGTSTPTLSPTEDTLVVPSPGTEEVTLTPTRVIQEGGTATPTPRITTPPTATPTAAAIAPSTPAATAAVSVPIATVVKPGPVENLLKNGDFEQGFDERGVALSWEPFKNDAVLAFYGRETFPYVESGSSAQRITMAGATEYNRYAGIYQQVAVVPNQVYTLTLYGQIRTGLGDVTQSSYGYRMQYTVANLKNWQNVPEADWVELPWDEQLLNASATQFYSYTTTLQPTSDRISLFVRAWNKWPDPGEAQYTFDNFSLVGPTFVSEPLITGASPATITTTVTPGDPMINKPLPVTGAGDGPNLMGEGRFWIGVLILLLLALGSIYRARWNYR